MCVDDLSIKWLMHERAYKLLRVFANDENTSIVSLI